MYNPNLLAQHWAELRQTSPQLRIRDAAKQLEVTEVELVALGLGTTATRLHTDFKGLLKRLPTLGSVMALTRSDAAVHEITGYFDELHL
ncbi:MAG: hemin-degrading factor, partial [Thiothrix sp.]